MRLLLDPQGVWIGRPGRLNRLLQGNQNPVASDDPLTILKDSAPVTVAVLDNDVKVSVPPFVGQDEDIVVNTETMEYVERA